MMKSFEQRAFAILMVISVMSLSYYFEEKVALSQAPTKTKTNTGEIVEQATNCQGTALIKEEKDHTCVLIDKTSTQFVLSITTRAKTPSKSLRIVLANNIVTNVEHRLDSASAEDYKKNGAVYFEEGDSSSQLDAQLMVYNLPTSSSDEVSLKFYAHDKDKKISLNGVLYGVVGAKRNITEIKKIPNNVLNKFKSAVNKAESDSKVQSLSEFEKKLTDFKSKKEAANVEPAEIKKQSEQPSNVIVICTPAKVSKRLYSKKIPIDTWDMYKQDSYLGECRVGLRPEPYSIIE